MDHIHKDPMISLLILGLRPANERLHYKGTPSLIGWVQTLNHSCNITTTQITTQQCVYLTG